MNAIEFKNVSKKFKKGESFDSLRDFIPNLVQGLFGRNGKDQELHGKEFWALKDVSFELKKGECMGIIGPNGSGKSTTLKLLSKILKPTKGEIKINGRLSALIEVGAGFHGDLTGRENIYLNGAIIGMKKREIDKKFDSIVEFSELGDFIDTPVKRYSSGMYARLGFSVAAHLDPEILLVDEVLSVGDHSFQAKCIEKIQEMKSNGTTIVFISHNMEAVLSICLKAILLHKGSVVLQGVTEETVRQYQKGISKKLNITETKDKANYIAEIENLFFLDKNGNDRISFSTGETMIIRIGLKAYKKVSSPVLGIAFYDERGICIYGHNSKIDKYDFGDVSGTLQVEVEYPNILFQPGTYFVTAAIFESSGTKPHDFKDRHYSFVVSGKNVELGVIKMPHVWTIYEKPSYNIVD